MTKRLDIICSHLTQTGVFADVGCDHGYCAQYMLDRGLCRRAYVTDISRASLEKAEKLLAPHIAAGRCVPVCTDGLKGLPEPCDLVLIAGMGGEEIVKILHEGVPSSFLLQPMKNTEKVRAFLLSKGCRITLDYTFQDGKYYDLISGENTGGDCYSDRELLFGRDNLKNPSQAFIERTGEELEKVRAYLRETKTDKQREILMERRDCLEEIYHAFKDDL